ncbi:MAG TPA: hypothetical protein VGU90_14455, partial [Terriglobales bacterium]|nr:hypothetical protein [Terriglobales bacterium]
MKMRLSFHVLSILIMFASGIQNAGAQRQHVDSGSQDYSSRTHAIDEADSRAEQQAEHLVSLPPEKIILLLQQEPGLFLEVKKMLVRKAFAQGR